MRSVRRLLIILSLLCGVITGVTIWLIFSITPAYIQTPILTGVITGIIVTSILLGMSYYTILRV
ncbi:MAG: hypothetical protein QXJ68_00505 [Methanocellales archaeon]